jgi:site-specific recombinase XerD
MRLLTTQTEMETPIYTIESIDKFRSYLSARGLSDNTVLSYTKDVRAFLESCDGWLSQEDFASCAAYWLSTNRKHLAPKTIGRHLCSLKAFAKWGDIPNDLNTYRAPVALKANPHPLPEGIEGVKRMIAVTENPEHQALVALCGLAGLRISETLTIRASSIDIHIMVLTVRGKGDKTRTIPISPALWDVIEDSYYKSLLRDNDSTFVKISNRSSRKVVTSLGRRAGIGRRVASHDLRATFATTVYENTKNLRIVQELLGHSSVAITETYLGVTSDSLRKAVII